LAREPLAPREGYIIPYDKDGIGRLELLDLKGIGTYGQNWKARDIDSGTISLVKIFQAVDPGVEEKRVRNEAEVKIDSDYVVPVISHQKWDSSSYVIVFEYFEAEDLDKVISKGELTDSEKASIFKGICHAVYDAHRHNVVHRDLKPANVLVLKSGDVKIIDFGISKFKDRTKITVGKDLMGTPMYIAPEIWAHGGVFADFECDIYGLGCILFEMITGKDIWKFKGWKSFPDFMTWWKKHSPESVVLADDVPSNDISGSSEAIEMMTRIEAESRPKEIKDILALLGITFDKPPLHYVECTKGGELWIVSGENKGAITPIYIGVGELVVLGRDHIAPNYGRLSREHIEIRRTEEGMSIRDVGSKNESSLNGIKLIPGEWHDVDHGDNLRMDDVFIEFKNA
jgi:serine/threonine-protein kinase